MPRKLQVLAPTRYPWRFNSPRQSRHEIARRNFIPFNKVSRAAEGLTVFNPLPWRRFDLVHAFNRIPIGPTPFVIGFESHLPRAFGYEKTAIFRLSRDMLANEKCRRIIAISQYAERQFLRQHREAAEEEALKGKLEVRYPNLPVPAHLPDFAPDRQDRISLVFVGNHFARKGGCVALRIAEIASRRGIPVQVDIVSSVEVGAASWVDPLRASYFDADKVLLASLGNVVHHAHLPNDQVLALVRKAHFLLLPTFSDTFGYSAIEAMAQGTPVIATDQGALGEFIDEANGILLPLERDEVGEWKHIGRRDRDTTGYERLFSDELQRLAEESLAKIQALAGSPAYASLRVNAHATARTLFGAEAANEYWDRLYEEAVS